jgi:very-short-patch-repair endonuclease
MEQATAIAPEVAPHPHSIRVSCSEKLNLADFQNSVPLLRELALVNGSERETNGLQLRLESFPPFLKPKTWNIDACAPGETYPIKDCDVLLDGAMLGKLTEAETATVSFALFEKAGTADESCLVRHEQKVELLPRNQWGGLSHLPDLVAAFVQPNELAVDRLLKQAAEVLRAAGKNPAIDGYKGGAKRAWELASALWTAIAGLGLDYALPPASFEHRGQKVRSPSQIVDARIATCLDSTLLFCAALEQAGLNPLVVFTKGHAFGGVWLRKEEFSTVVIDDVTAIRKRVKLKELVLFETTLVAQRPAPSFSYAAEVALAKIGEDRDEEFELAVDIQRARMQRIKPLASADSQVVSIPEDVQAETRAPTFEEAPDLPDADVEEASESLSPTDRLARWQRKLLDLSLRNNLLNFRSGKKALRLVAPDPGALEDLLSDGTPLKLLPRPDLMDGADPRDQGIHEQRSREDVRREHALDALARREVFLAVDEKELETRLVDLFRSARSTLQEGGANTLFLALGFLNWTREDKGGQKCKAPLILIPVSLQRKSARSGFSLTLHEDEPRFNPTLIEMLRQDFRLNLGVGEKELPRDDAGLDVAGIWKSVSHAIRDIKGWEVTEEVVLSMFSFAKYLMWVDLTQRTEQLRQNPVVRHLIDTPRDPYPSSVAFPDPRCLDREYAPEKTFCPLPADSSQLSAVMAANNGKDFVLIGPPGTGKSQTISNLIAQCLAENKRVLFVSEKIAALDVVYRRLREVGLGEFCLELHSNKARKLDVLAQLQRAWDAQGEVDPDEWRAQADRLRRYRAELNQYVERLHQKHRNGLTLYKAIGVVVDGEDVPVLGLSWPGAHAHDARQRESLREAADRLSVNAAAVGAGQLRDSTLSGIGHDDWTPTWQQAFIDAARAIIPVAQHLEQQAAVLQQAAGISVSVWSRRARFELASLARALPAASGHDWSFVFRADARQIFARMHAGLELVQRHKDLTAELAPAWPEAVVAKCRRGLALLAEQEVVRKELGRPWAGDVVEELTRGLHLLDKIGEGHRRLSVQYSDQVEQLNAHQLLREWEKAKKAIWPMSWLRKKKIAKALEAVVTGEGQPRIAEDLAVLARLSELRSEVSKLEMGPATDGIWTGLKTRPEFAQTALKFQAVIQAVHARQPWSDEGFDAIGNGRCGSRLEAELRRVRALQALDADIVALGDLAGMTDTLWQGHQTHRGRLEASLRFQVERTQISQQGALRGAHDEVAASECGASMAEDHRRLTERGAVEQQLHDYDELGPLTGGTWAGLKTHLEDVARVSKFHASLVAAVSNLSASPEEAQSLNHALECLVVQGNALLADSGPIASAGHQYVTAWQALQPVVDKLSSLGSFTETGVSGINDLATAALVERCQAIVQSEARLHTWCAWRKSRQEALLLGLSPLVAAIEAGGVEPKNALRALETAYCRWWLNAAVDEEPVIRGFVSAEHEKRITDFRALEKRFTELTRAWLRSSLCANLPKSDTITRNSEWGILRREISKKKQHLPLRELMQSIPSALTKLTPCLLMSPLSIAQYLSPEASAFDLVIFDEASQIPVWDAIGAIARGRQVVMVGDPKQLPPTSFFDRAEGASDDDDGDHDLESILDECMGANLPTLNLSWHYRSRNESLIAFSNHRYYGGGLVTFPSPVTNDRAVSVTHVNGVYEKGGARINKPEAKALVADIVARLRSPGFQESKLTIGVVTFNSEQMNLIEDLLDEERRKDPTLETYFSEMELEPLFVKNLESVQGDERDIMYFSITYGPDHSGNVSMNFGPMNRDGGERRLNVAITRARQELKVFSSLRAEQFDLSRSQGAGVRDLKHFLEFAERGARALAEATKGSLGGFESPFEQAVAAVLISKGWQVHTQIGASAFRVDLAVVHPDAPGIYLCGVECDGATYHRSATARDRDMLREQVLRGLGWEILRVWSTDWWIDKAGTFAKLQASLEALLSRSRQERSRQAELAKVNQAAEDAIAKAREDAGSSVDAPSEALYGHKNSASYVRDTGVPEPLKVEETPEQAYADSQVVNRAQFGKSFVEADLRDACVPIDPDAFFLTSYEPQLKRMIEYVTAVEGPILDTVLARRIARGHGWQRTGARIQERVNAVALTHLQTTSEDVGTFFWAATQRTDMSVAFRGGSEDGRSVDEICMSELVSLAKDVVARGVSGDAAVVAMARQLGLQRVRAASRGRFERAFANATANAASDTNDQGA